MGLARELFASLGLSECAMKVLDDCADADLLISKVNTEVRHQAWHLFFDAACSFALAMVKGCRDPLLVRMQVRRAIEGTYGVDQQGLATLFRGDGNGPGSSSSCLKRGRQTEDVKPVLEAKQNGSADAAAAGLLGGGPVSPSPPAAAVAKPKKRQKAKPKGGVDHCGNATAANGPSKGGPGFVQATPKSPEALVLGNVGAGVKTEPPMQPQFRPERPQAPVSALQLGAGLSEGRCKDEEQGVRGAPGPAEYFPNVVPQVQPNALPEAAAEFDYCSEWQDAAAVVSTCDAIPVWSLAASVAPDQPATGPPSVSQNTQRRPLAAMWSNGSMGPMAQSDVDLLFQNSTRLQVLQRQLDEFQQRQQQMQQLPQQASQWLPMQASWEMQQSAGQWAQAPQQVWTSDLMMPQDGFLPARSLSQNMAPPQMSTSDLSLGCMLPRALSLQLSQQFPSLPVVVLPGSGLSLEGGGGGLPLRISAGLGMIPVPQLILPPLEGFNQ